MAKYDPNKKWQWSNEDKFEISGHDFGLFLNTLRSILSTEEARKILLAERASESIEKIMAEYVERGVIKEVVEQAKMEVKRNDKS